MRRGEDAGLQPFTPISARNLFAFWERTTDPVQAPHFLQVVCDLGEVRGKVSSGGGLRVSTLLFLLCNSASPTLLPSSLAKATK